MTFINSGDAAFSQAVEASLAVPFKPLSTNPATLDPASVPQGFNSQLADLLWKIRTAKVPLTGKIAQYAGFYLDGGGVVQWDPTTDNGNESDDNTSPPPTNKQPNKSLDKLTFLIMFILPFRTKTPTTYYGDPLDTAATTWSSLANKLRLSPLKKLNTRGEQVNAQNVHCDDAGVDLGDEYDTPAAFKHYGFDSAVSGVAGTAVKHTRLYVYLNLSTEGSFSDDENDSSNTRSVTQQPENILGLMNTGSPGPTYKERLVQSGTYASSDPFAPFLPHFPATPADYDSQLIEQELTSKRYYVVSKTSPADKLYLQLLQFDENLSDEVFELKGLKVRPAGVTNTSWFAARYYSKPHQKGDDAWFDNFGFDNGLTGLTGGVQFEKLALDGRSGMTLGWGLDLGRWWPQHYYNINFTILIYDNHAVQTPSVTDFVLLYRGTRVSDPLSFTVSATNATAVQTALVKLLELKNKAWNNTNVIPHNPDTIVVNPVLSSGYPDYTKGYVVTIRRVNMTGAVDSYHNVYAGNVFYHIDESGEATANVKLLVEDEKARFVVNPDNVDLSGQPKAWNEFTDLMTKFFGGQNWLDPSHFKDLTAGHEAEEIARFEELMKRSIGLQGGAAFVLIRNNRPLLKKFRLPAVADLYPRFVKHFVVPNYYDTIVKNVPAALTPRLNAAERYILLSRAYQGPTGSNQDLNKAIESKNIDALIEMAKAFNVDPKLAERKKRIVNNLNDHFRRVLYRNVELT